MPFVLDQVDGSTASCELRAASFHREMRIRCTVSHAVYTLQMSGPIACEGYGSVSARWR
jgi:hypothetical protein